MFQIRPREAGELRSALFFHQFPLLACVPQRRKNAGLQNFGLGPHPVFHVLSLRLSALMVELARAHPYLSLQQFHHQFLPFTSSGNAIHCLHPTFH